MNKPQILVVEDDAAIGNLIATTLETQNYQYHRASTGAGAVLDALSYRPDVMLLDLGLPDMDGVDIIKKIRDWSNLPIIVVSARSEDGDKVAALDAGLMTTSPSPSRWTSCWPGCGWRCGGCGMTASESATRPASMKTAGCGSTMPPGCAYRDGEEVHLTPLNINSSACWPKIPARFSHTIIF